MKAFKVCLLVTLILPVATVVHAQGSLTPPGAPAATMKTLEQIEPRIDLATVAGDAISHFVITNSGSYYLSENLEVTKTVGIYIKASDVALDLNGFNIFRFGGSEGYGIRCNGYDHVSVRNGNVAGFDYGIWCDATFSDACLFEKLAVSGCKYYGILAGKSSRIIDCRAHNNVGVGIYASSGSSLSGCTANNNSGTYGIYAGFGSTLAGCTANYNFVQYGIYAGGGSIVEQCSASSNDGTGSSSYGIYAGDGSSIVECTASYNGNANSPGTASQGVGIYLSSKGSVRDCTVSRNEGDGIRALNLCLISGNICEGNGYNGDGAGIHTTATDTRIESNHVRGNDRGLELDNNENWVANNTVQDNTDNYDFAAGNQLNLLISEVPETIDWPASVKLAGTLVSSDTSVHAIRVTAADVTIDLDGHALVGPGSGTSSGIFIDGEMDRVTVRNGTIRGFSHGVRCGSSPAYPAGCLFENLAVSDCTTYGILAGVSSRLIDCHAHENSGWGIWGSEDISLRGCSASDNDGNGIYTENSASIVECTAYGNGDYGIRAGSRSLIKDSTATRNTGVGSASFGIYAGDYSSVLSCVSSHNDHTNGVATSQQGVGIRVTSGSTIRGCTVDRNSGDGIFVPSYTFIADNTCDNNGAGGDGAGIHTTHTQNRIEGNTVTRNDRGIDVDSTGSIIVRNTASGNTTQYDIAGGNDVGTIQTTPVGAGAWDNFEF